MKKTLCAGLFMVMILSTFSFAIDMAPGYVKEIQNVSADGYTVIIFSNGTAYNLKSSVVGTRSYDAMLATALTAIASNLRVYFGYDNTTNKNIQYFTIINY